MKIISTFTDYYDFVGDQIISDNNIIYTRNTFIDVSNKYIFNTFKKSTLLKYAHLGKKYFIKKIEFKIHQLLIGKYILTYLEQIYTKKNTSFFRVITEEDRKNDKELPLPLEIQPYNYSLLQKIECPVIKLPDCKYMEKLTTIKIPNLSYIQGIHNVLNPYDAYKTIEEFFIDTNKKKTVKRDRSKRII